MLDTIRIVRRGHLRFAIDPLDGTELPIPAGGAGDDDSDDDDSDEEDVDDEDADQDGDDDEDDSDEDELGDKGQKALARERKARRQAERENKRLKRQLKKTKSTSRQDRDEDDGADDDRDSGRDRDRDRSDRLEVARERAAARAERYAVRAGVDVERVDRFVKLLDVDGAIEEDGSIDNDELKEIVTDELELWPEFKSAKDEKDDDGHGDAEQGPRKTRPKPLSDRVESNLERIARRTGIPLASGQPQK